MPRGPAARRQLAPAAQQALAQARRAAPSHLPAWRQMLRWRRLQSRADSRRWQGRMHRGRTPPGAGSARAAPRRLPTTRRALGLPPAPLAQTCRVRSQMLPGWQLPALQLFSHPAPLLVLLSSNASPPVVSALSAIQLSLPSSWHSQPSKRPAAAACARYHWCDISACPCCRCPPTAFLPPPVCRWPHRRGQRGVMHRLVVPDTGRCWSPDLMLPLHATLHSLLIHL